MPRSQPRRFRIAFFPLLLLLSSQARADRLAVAGGAMTSFNYTSAAAGIVEYRPSLDIIHNLGELRPMLGVLGNTKGGVYGYVGLRLRTSISETWSFENAAGIGAYYRGSGPDLYGTLEFCLPLSLLKKVSDENRVGIQVFHVSNAGLGAKDPGANTFMVLFEHAFPTSY